MNQDALWEFDLSSWIIQDGNYPDFEVGQEYAFAIEFGCDSLTRGHAPGWIKKTGPGRYAWSAEVLVVEEKELTVLEAHIRFYTERSPKLAVKPHEFLRGEGSLGVDPFFWKENHAEQKGRPPLIYRWSLEGILLETTPWQESRDEQGRKNLSRSGQERSFESRKRTDAWADDEGRAEYLLQCKLLGLA